MNINQIDKAVGLLKTCRLSDLAYRCYMVNYDVDKCVKLLQEMKLDDDVFKNKISEVILMISDKGDYK